MSRLSVMGHPIHPIPQAMPAAYTGRLEQRDRIENPIGSFFVEHKNGRASGFHVLSRFTLDRR